MTKEQAKNIGELIRVLNEVRAERTGLKFEEKQSEVIDYHGIKLVIESPLQVDLYLLATIIERYSKCITIPKGHRLEIF